MRKTSISSKWFGEKLKGDGQFLRGHTLIWCATEHVLMESYQVITLTILLTNVWLDLFTIPIIIATNVVQIDYE